MFDLPLFHVKNNKKVANTCIVALPNGRTGLVGTIIDARAGAVELMNDDVCTDDKLSEYHTIMH